MDAGKISQLRDFIGDCKSDPSLLHNPSLIFFRDYLESLGAQIPPRAASKSHVKQESEEILSAEFRDCCNSPKLKTENSDDDDEIVESDIELEGEVVKPDNGSPQKMGDPSIEVTEESRDVAQISKAKAVDAIFEGKLDEAIEHLTDAITLNPISSILYATRASVFVMMCKPNAAIRDSNAALQINPDSAKGYKSRGMAKALLGKWEEAASDLHIASKLDLDEEIHSILKMVVRNIKRLEEHRKRYEYLRKEREQNKAKKHQHAKFEKSQMKQESDEMSNAEFHDRYNNPKRKTEDFDDDEIIESDIDLEGEVVEPDNDSPQKMGDPSVQVTEESRDVAQISKANALDAISEGKLDEAIEHLTDAITLNPTSSILYATRASVFVMLCKPNASIRDANAALQINPDSGKGYKSRGMAKALLGKWEEAASDLHIASKLDLDEEIYSMLKMVVRNTQKLEEHRRRYECLRQEREQKKVEKQHQRAKVEQDHKVDSEYLSALQDGKVLSIHSSSELEIKLNAAAELSRLAVLYFTATWCGPCRLMVPAYNSLAEQHPKVVFLKIDIDELSDVAHQWNINSVPAFFFLKNGKEIDKVVGADKNELEKKISLHAPKVLK